MSFLFKVGNYLCGVGDTELSSDNSGRASSGSGGLGHKLGKSVSHFVTILGLLFSSGVSVFLFVVLLAGVVFIQFIIYWVGLLSGKFLQVLVNKDLSGFQALAAYAIFLICVNSTMTSLNDFVTRLLNIVWRKRVTGKLHERYFADKNFYYVQQQQQQQQQQPKQQQGGDQQLPRASSREAVLADASAACSDSDENDVALGDRTPPHVFSLPVTSTSSSPSLKANLDHPDQRITQDVNSLCKSISTLVPLILISPFVIAWYGYQVTTIHMDKNLL